FALRHLCPPPRSKLFTDCCHQSDFRLILYFLRNFPVERVVITTSTLPMVINIRLATLADIAALQELIRESVSILGAQYYTSRQIESGLTHVFGVDTQLIVDGTYLVAEVEKQIAGSGGWSKRK